MDPAHSRKMVARLQSVGANALLRTSRSNRVQAGSKLEEQIDEAVDQYVFLFSTLGVKYRPVAK
jgi:prolyl oligopeptidase PreP (S9A serine peptidase family)